MSKDGITSHKLSTINYAVGLVADFIDVHTQLVEVVEGLPEKEVAQIEQINDHKVGVRAMMDTIEQGVKQLISDNTDLRNKITLIELAIKGGTL